MRIKVEISLEGKNNIIPFDHQYLLASYIYRSIEKIDPVYALELHRPQKYKHFTFSYLMTHKRKIIPKEGIMPLTNRVVFYLSSPDRTFIKKVVEALVVNQKFRIGNVKGIISSLEILKKPLIPNKVRFRTLSPIVVKKWLNQDEWVNLFPTDDEFYERLKENLISRYLSFLGKQREDNFLKDLVINIKITNFKPKRHNINGTYHRGSLCDMIVEGNKELIEYAYYAGLGEKNAMGFGMVKII